MADEVRIARIAARQYGNVTRAQLLEVGLGPGAIRHRLRTGWLYRVHHCVYAVGRPARTALERAAAAVLAGGSGALLSQHAGLALWGFVKRWPALPEITVSVDRRPDGVVVHLSRSIMPGERTRHLGIPVTSPARTVLDCAPSMPPRALTRVVNDALHTPFLKRSQLAEVCQSHPLHPGTRLLHPFYDTSDGPTRSDWEDDFPAFCERFALPKPRLNVELGRYTVDAYFPAEGVIVELDGWGSHSGKDRFEGDRERDAAHLAAGLVTVRVTWKRIHQAPRREAERLHRILARRRAERPS